MNKFLYAVVLACAGWLAWSGSVACTPRAAPKSIVVVSPMGHPSLRAAVKGFLAELRERGWDESRCRIRTLDAQGDFARVPSLVEEALRERCDLVFAVSTPAAQKAFEITEPRGVPLVFAAVSDPLGAGLVRDLDAPGTHATGVQDRYPTRQQADLFHALSPAARSMAMLFDPSEQNSRFLVGEMTAALARHDVRVEPIEVRGLEALSAAVERAFNAHDAVLVDGDNLVTENLEIVLKAAESVKKPVYVGDPDSVQRGATATIGPRYERMGRQAGIQAAHVLEGRAPGLIPVSLPIDYALVINRAAAVRYGLEIGDSVLSKSALWEGVGSE